MSLDRVAHGIEVAAIPGFGDGALAERMAGVARPAARTLRALSHTGRLMILCHLAAAERSVSELEALLGQRQAAVSQQLARLRADGLVATRREGKAIYYSLRDRRVLELLRLMPDMLARPA